MAQIGSINLQTENNGVVTLPVFDTADVGSDVYDMVRVQTPSGVGFIPFVDTADATFDYLRLQTQNQGVLGAHDEASLIPPGLIDDFEDNNISEYDGETGQYQTQSNIVKVGTYALRGDNSTNDDEIIYSTSGLNNYPSAGDTFEFYMRLSGRRSSDTTGVRPQFNFAWQSNSASAGRYGIEFGDSFTGSSEFAIIKDNDGTQIAGSDSYVTPNDEWHRVVVDWGTGGSLSADLYDSGGANVVSISGNDSSYTSGGIGFTLDIDTNITGSGTLYSDHWKIL